MNSIFHLVHFLVFTTFILNYYAVSAGHGHKGHNNGVGSGQRQTHRPISLNRGSSRSHTSHSHRRIGSSSTGHRSRHNSFAEKFSGSSRSRYHHSEPHLGSRHSISSDLRHSSKLLNRVSKINNHILDSSSHHIHKNVRNKHISSNSINISPTVNTVSYNSPIIGGVGVVPAGIGIPINTVPAVAVGLAPSVVNIQPGFTGAFNDPFPPTASYPYPYEYPLGVRPNIYPPVAPPLVVDSPYFDSPPNEKRPRCYEEFRQITNDGKEIIILKFYSLDEFYLRDLRKYNNHFVFEDSDYPCDYYQPNIR